jgi:hypothetical protein
MTIILATFILFKRTDNLAISSDTSKCLGRKIKAKFVDYKVSLIFKIGLVVFEL